MKRMMSKLLALLMACLMMTGMLPLDALAEEVNKFYSNAVSIAPQEDEDGEAAEGDGGEGSAAEPVTFTVSFYVLDSLYHQETVDANTLVSWPDDPMLEADGDETPPPFLSWYAQGEESPFGRARLITEDVRLDARFSANHLVTFYNTDGQEMEVVELDADDVVPEPTTSPTLAMGEVVAYWYIDGQPDIPFAFGETTNSNLQLRPYLGGSSLAVFITQSVEVEPQTGDPGFLATDPQVLNPSLQMTREGYDFSHWSATEGGEATFDFAGTPINGTVYIYAVWVPQQVTYLINYWCEKSNIDDPGDPSDAANLGNYEFIYAKEMPEVAAGTEITIDKTTADANYASAGQSARYVLYYADFIWSETKTVSGTGTTVINIYYERTKYTFNLKLSANMYLRTGAGDEYTNTTYSVTAKLGQYIYDVWPAQVWRTDNSQVFINWGNYYGLEPQTLNDSYINFGMNGNNATYKKPGKQSTANIVPTWGSANFRERRYYYLENLAGDTSGEAFVAKNYASDTTTRYYTFNQKSSPNWQGNSNPTTAYAGWPGRQIEGFETITTALTKAFVTVYEYPDTDLAAGKDYVLQYHMRRLSYEMTLVPNGGTFPEGYSILGYEQSGSNLKKTYQYQAPITLPPAPEKDYATFVGWYIDENFNTPYTGTPMPGNAMILYAKYVGTECAVNYYDGSTLVRANTYARDEFITYHDLAGTPYASYTVGENVPGKGIFGGWYYQVGAATVQFPLDIRVQKEVYNLYARWDQIGYDVVYKDSADMDADYGDISVSSGDRNTIAMSGNRSPAVTRTGYAFVGWNTAADGSGITFRDSSAILGDMVVYAMWAPVPYTVTYILNGVTHEVETYYYEDTVTVLPDIEREGYDFSGWSLADGTSLAAGETFTMQTSNVTIYGATTAHVHDVTYILNGNAYYGPEAVVYGTNVSLRNVTPEAGYAFKGWETEHATISGNGFTMPDNDVTLYGVTEIQSFTVEYWLDGAQQGEPVAYEYGAPVTVWDDAVREGHAFSGWKRLDGTAMAAGSTFAMPDENLTIYGSTETLPYTVDYVLDGEPYEAQETYPYGESVTAKAAPFKHGHTFTGWTLADDTTIDPEAVFAMPAANLTLYGTAVPNAYRVTYILDSNPVSYHEMADVPFGTNVTLEGVTPEKGYEFTGWTTQDVAISGNGFTMPDQDVTLYGETKTLPYTVDYVLNNAPFETQSTHYYGDSVTVKDEPVWSGHVFSGWVLEDGTEYAPNAIFIMPAEPVVLYGTMTPNAYTVRYVLDDETYLELERVPYGTNVTLEAVTLPEGYAFTGWETEDVTIAGNGFTMPDNDVTLYGYLNAQSYTVTYLLDGDTYFGPVSYTYGTEQEVLVAATKEGHTFSGWETADAVVSGGKLTMPANDVTFRGTMTIAPFTVEYRLNGNPYGGAQETYLYGAPVVVKSAPIEHGYAFSGWTLEAGDAYTPDTTFAMPAQNLVLNGTLTPNTHDVIYMLDNVQYGETETVPYGTNVEMPDVAPDVGYEFIYWTTTDATIDGNSFIMPDGDVILYGYTRIMTFTVEYWLDNVLYAGPVPYEYGENVTVLADVAREGHRFSGWTLLDGTEMVAGSEFPMPAHGLRIYGSTAASEFTVDYRLNDSLYEAQETYTFGTEVTVKPAPAQTGYTFSGWMLANGTPIDPDSTFDMPAANLTLYGTLTANEYTVTYLLDNAQHGGIDTVSFGTDVTLRAYEAPEGYAFTGWTTTDAVIEGNGFTMPDGHVILHGSLQALPFTVTYELNGAQYEQPETYDFGTAVNVRPDVEIEGYAFSGWDTSAVTAIDGSFTMPARNITISGTTQAKDYTVRYVLNGTEPHGETETYAYDTEVTVEAAIDEHGYTFTGWATEGGDPYAPDSTFTMPAENLVLYGTLVPNEHTVTYMLNDELHSGPETVAFGTNVTLLNYEAPEGYAFIDWTTQNADIEGDSFTMPDNDVVLEGYTQILSFTVEYILDGVTYDGPTSYEFDTAVTVLADAVREGHSFSGWTLLDGTEMVAGSEFPMPATSLTVYGSTDAAEYTVDYVLDEAPYETPVAYVYNTEVTVKSAPAQTGYTFDGWTLANGTPIDPDSTFDMPAANLTLYGTLTANEYTVTYLLDNAQHGGIDTVSFGTDVTLRAYEAPEGYAFTGWTTTDAVIEGNGFTMPDGHVILHGSLQALPFTVTYELNGAQYEQPETYDFGTAVNVRPDVEIEGYAFSGWDTSAVTVIDDSFTMPARNITISGTTQAKDYTVRYVLNGTEPHGETATYAYDTEVSVEAAIDEHGYTFTGWAAEGGDPYAPDSTFTMPAENLVLYGTLVPNEHTVTYMLNDELHSGPETVAFGTNVTLLNYEAPEGYAFIDWTTQNADIEGDSFTMPDNDVVLEGYTQILSFTVEYILDGVTYDGPTSYEYGATVAILGNADRDGYNFSGWSLLGDIDLEPAPDPGLDTETDPDPELVDEDVSPFSTMSTRSLLSRSRNTFAPGFTYRMPATNLTLFGSTGLAEYALDYVLDGDPYETQEKHVFGDLVTAKDEVIREGYTFSGWRLATDEPVLPGETFNMPPANMTLYGKMTQNKNILTYVLDGEVYDGPKSVLYGTDLTLLTVDVPQGYTFVPWTTTDVEINGNGFTMPDRDVTLYGSLKPLQYKVSYELNGKAYGTAETYDYGTDVFVWDDVVRTGYTFSGWSLDGQIKTARSSFKMPAGDVILYGTTNLRAYTVTYLLDGKAYGDVDEVQYGTYTKLRAAVQRIGYVFSGWKVDNTSLAVNNGAFLMPEENVVIRGTLQAVTTTPDTTDPVVTPEPTEEPTPTPTQGTATARPSASPSPLPTVAVNEITQTPYTPEEVMIMSPDPLPERELEIDGTKYTIKEDNVPLAGIGSRNMGDCPN